MQSALSAMGIVQPNLVLMYTVVVVQCFDKHMVICTVATVPLISYQDTELTPD